MRTGIFAVVVCLKLDAIQMEDVQTLWSGTIPIQAFHKSNNSLAHQYHSKIQDVPEMIRGAHSGQRVKANHVFQDMKNPVHNKLLPVLLATLVLKARKYLHKSRKFGLAAHNPGKRARKLAQLDPLGLFDYNNVFFHERRSWMCCWIHSSSTFTCSCCIASDRWRFLTGEIFIYDESLMTGCHASGQ